MYQVLVNAITSNFDIKHKTYKPFPINIEQKIDVDHVMGINTDYTMHSGQFQPIKLLKSYLITGKIRKKKLRKCSPFKVPWVIFWTQQHEKFAKQNATTDDLKMVTSSKESCTITVLCTLLNQWPSHVLVILAIITLCKYYK